MNTELVKEIISKEKSHFILAIEAVGNTIHNTSSNCGRKTKTDV